MGQIVGLKAKPKRCNLNKLSQLGIPAAGEYILVSYDNSMTANGQGNFDRYIVGDGRTAATALELKYLDDSTRPYIVEEVNKAVADIQPIEITGDVTNAPDEEDLTSENQGGTDVLKFKDKAYNSALYSGLGRVYLRKNIVTLEGTGKNVLTQAMVNTANTIYHIQYDYVLGENVTIPAGCMLKFEGGSIAGTFTLAGSDTVIESEKCCIKKDVTIGGTWGNQTVYSKWLEFVSSDDGTTDNVIQFKQLQNLINGTKGCNVEFEYGYYQSSVLMATPNEYKEIDGVTYPYWPMNTYARDTEIVLHVQEIPFVDINFNGSTIKMINAVYPGAVVLVVDGVDNSYVHDGTIIGLAYDYSYSEYVNYSNTIQRNYEWQGGVYQHGGFCTIYNMNIHHFNGDGIMVGGGHWQYSANNIADYYAKGYLIENSEVSYCGRNGVALHSSKEGQLKNVHIHHIGSDAASGVIGSDGIMGRSPQAGIDIEFEDGLEDTPVMNWDSLYIHDCRAKTFVFAKVSNHYCSLKSFRCQNSTFIGFPITNNWQSETGNNVFSNCYFENPSDSSVGGSLLGSGLTFNDCSFVFKRGGFNFHGKKVFNNCTLIDERTENLNIGLGNINNEPGGEYNNCKFTLKGYPGYLGNNSKFYGCTIDFHYAYAWCVLASEFYDCVFNNEVEDSTYTFGFSKGSYIMSTVTFKLVNCVFDRGSVRGGGIDEVFISIPNVVIENCIFKKRLVLHTNSGSNFTLKNVSSESFYTRPFSDRVSLPQTNPYKLLIDGCNFDKFRLMLNENSAYDDSVTIKNSEFITDQYFSNAAIADSKFSFDSQFSTISSDNGHKISAKNCIVGLISNIDSTSIRTSTYELENCYVDGLSEASYKGAAINCVFKIPLPTKGATSDRPTLDVSRAGFRYFDETLGKPIWWNGTGWVDATGAAV